MEKTHIKIIIPKAVCFKCGGKGEVRMFSGRWVCNKCLITPSIKDHKQKQ